MTARAVTGQGCGVWQPVPAAGSSLLGIGYGGGQFVGVGTAGAERSPDGVTWSATPIDLSGGDLDRVAWNGALWVAVGSSGKIYTSPDGVTWTPRTSPTTRHLAGIAWGNSLWVAVGELKTIITSPDGKTWTQVSADLGGYLTSVIWTGTSFVAVGEPGAVMTSNDGATWVPSTVAGEDWLMDVVWASGQLVVATFDGTVLTKNSFSQWTPRAETGLALRRLVWTGARYVAAGDDAKIISSPDAATWETDTINGQVVSGSLTGIAWSGAQMIVAGSPSGAFRSGCGVYADVTFSPPSPQIGQAITVSAVKPQGFGLARWDFGETGCDGGAPTRDVACLSNPCTYSVSFAYASSGQKTVSFYAWTGLYDGEGNRIFVLARTKKVTVAATGTCATCLTPGPPVNPSPANGAVRPGGSVVLQWGAPATGTPPFTYDLVLDGGTVCLGTAALQCSTSGIAESSTPHAWQVTAHNACGQATSLAWTFLACSAPGLPVAAFDWQPSGPLPSWPAQPQPFVGQQVAFNDHSTNGPGDWAWAGLTASGLLSDHEPSVTWWSPGARPVGLRAENCLGWSELTTKSVVINDDVRPRLWAFDFGTDTSPVAAGFTKVVATPYSPALGYGWQAGLVTGRERPTGDALVRDFVFTQNATFAVDVPNRTYDAVLWMGDTARAHDQMAVYLEGDQVDLVATDAGQAVLRVYRVTVADGQLNVRIADLGGADPNAVINGLEIFAADSLKVDFGTPGSPVAAGYRRASEATAFAAPVWCGWSAGKISSRDRGIGSDLLRDFAVTTDGTFSCALAPGIWDVSVSIGDATSPHDQIGVFLQGAQVDTVTRSAGQFAARKYRVKVADGLLVLRVADLGGLDANAVINGLEAARVGPFDFGTATSPMAPGFVGVSNATRYNATLGYGWLDGTVAARDRGVGGDLLRDFVFTPAATFAVDVPNGGYDVSVMMGDATSAHDQMAVILEGAQVAVVSTAKGKFVERTFHATVADGQLTVRVEDQGGSDANAVINGLSLAPSR
jgi:fibronectin type 3 domain-containing protein